MKSHTQHRLNTLIVPEEMSIRRALEALDKAGIGILLVCGADRKLKGVVTDGDVRRYLLRNRSLRAPISKLMNVHFISLPENEKKSAKNLLEKSKIDHIPILDGRGRVVDLISALDFVKTKEHFFDNPVVIMAGGEGTRLSPLTKIIPKPLIPVGDQTMIEMIMENFQTNGFHDFRIIVNYKKELIKSYFQENNLLHNVTFIDEKEYLGTAGGLYLLKHSLNTTFILSNCDIIAKLDYGLMLDWHKEHNADLTILGVRKRINIPYGVLNINGDNYVTDVDEKPNFTFMIMSGVYIMEPHVIELIPENCFYGIDSLIANIIESGKKVACFPMSEGWFDVGQFEEYKSLLRHFGELNA